MAALTMDEPRKNRRSIRLKGFDYSLPVAYFITICTHEREENLAKIAGHEVHLTKAGEIVRAAWLNLPQRFPTVILHDFVLMPNHLHAILTFAHSVRGDKEGAASSAPTMSPTARPSLGGVIRAFKSVSAISINRMRGRTDRPVWQRNYYEHIIRTSREFDETRKYIHENPMRWDTDPENVS